MTRNPIQGNFAAGYYEICWHGHRSKYGVLFTCSLQFHHLKLLVNDIGKATCPRFALYIVFSQLLWQARSEISLVLCRE